MHDIRRGLQLRVASHDAGDRPPTYRALAAAASAELLAVGHEADRIWRERVEGVGHAAVDLRLDPRRLLLDAEVRLPAGAARPQVQIGVGAVLAMDDLILSALCDNTFLAPTRAAWRTGDPDTPFEPPEPLDLSRPRGRHAPRYASYRNLVRGGLATVADLTFQLPRNPWRLQQAQLLSELALAWIIFHERAHWGLGHLDLVGLFHGGGDLRIAEINQTALEVKLDLHAVDDEAAAASNIQKVLELGADSHALLLLFLHCSQPGGPADRYEAAAANWGPEDPRRLSRLDFGQRVRVCLTAAGLACQAFERAQSLSRRRPGQTHPSPHARFMNMVVNATLLSPLVQQDDTGAWVLRREDRETAEGEDNEAFIALTQVGLGMSLVDMQVISDLLQTGMAPLAGEGPATWRAADWLHDLGAFWLADDPELDEPPTSAPALELLALRPTDLALREVLAELQERRFGAPFTLRLDGA